jgi:hypothetical protein
MAYEPYARCMKRINPVSKIEYSIAPGEGRKKKTKMADREKMSQYG